MNKEDPSRKLEELLEQSKHYDKDQRYMALSDMSSILSQGVRLNPTLEKKLGDGLVRLFDDKSVDVQSIAVKTVSILVSGKSIQEKTIADVFSTLGKKMTTGEDLSLRNLYAIGLKTCIGALDVEQISVVNDRVCPMLIQFSLKDCQSEHVQDVLEVVNDLLMKNSALGLEVFHDQLLQLALLQLARNPHPLVRKRAISMIGLVSSRCTDVLLNRTVVELKKMGGVESVLGIGAIGKEAGDRLSQHVKDLVPLLVLNLNTSQNETLGNDHREFIFQALESFLLRCPLEMEPHVSVVLDKAKMFLKYDPNWNDDGDEGMSDVEEEEDDDDEDDGGFSDQDEDDSSWKVRRACAKLFASLISHRPDLIPLLLESVEPLLLERCVTERIEPVRLDVLEAYKNLLDAIAKRKPTIFFPRLPLVFRKLTKSLKQTKAVKSRIALCQVLCKVLVLEPLLESSALGGLIALVVAMLKDRNPNVKMEALLMCKPLLALTSPEQCQVLKPEILRLIPAEWFKLVSEALKCTSLMVPKLPRLESVGSELLDAVLPRLKQATIDQEIKNSVIEATGVILSVFPLSDSPNKQTALNLLLERLTSEFSRLSVLRSMERIASSATPSSYFTREICPKLSVELVSLFRQQSREVRQHALTTLVAIVSRAKFVPSNLSAILKELSEILSDGKDSWLCHLALEFASLGLKELDASVVKQGLLPSVWSLCCTSTPSSLSSGPVHASLIGFLSLLAQSDGEQAQALFHRWFHPAAANHSYWQTLDHCGKSVLVSEAGAILVANLMDSASREKLLAGIVADMENKDHGTLQRVVNFLCVGELGLAKISPKGVEVKLMAAFEDESKDVRYSAASSLGKLVVGNPSSYLPILMKTLQGEESKYAFLPLTSLKEFLTACPPEVLSQENRAVILAVLTTRMDSAQEEVRMQVAECLGHLAKVDPDLVLPLLAATTTNELKSFSRWTKLTALRYAIVSNTKAEPLTRFFVPSVLPFLHSASVESKEQVEECKAALLACHALIHHMPQVCVAVFDSRVMESLLNATAVVPHLQKKVDFGPFKVLVDDSLPLRKAAFSCLLSLLENRQQTSALLGALPTGPLVPLCCKSMTDAPEDSSDIVLLVHLVLQQVCIQSPLAITLNLPALVQGMADSLVKFKIAPPPPPTTTTGSAATTAAKATEEEDPERKERKVAMIRSMFRLLKTVEDIPGTLENKILVDLVASIRNQDHLRKLLVEEGNGWKQ